MIKKNFGESDVIKVLDDDGVGKVILKDHENLSTTKLNEIKEKLGDVSDTHLRAHETLR